MNHLTRVIVGLALALGLLTGIGSLPASAQDKPRPVVADAASAHRVTGGCSNGACTVYLDKSSTIDLANGRVPAPPAAVTGVLRAAYYALAYGHVLIAKGWVARRTCVAFTLNIRPWVSQGLVGWRCPW